MTSPTRATREPADQQVGNLAGLTSAEKITALVEEAGMSRRDARALLVDMGEL